MTGNNLCRCHKIRIVILCKGLNNFNVVAYGKTTTDLSPQAYHLGMYGSRYVWILLGMYDEHWWLAKRSDLSCTTAQLAQAVSGYWSVNSLSTLSAGQRSVSGMVGNFIPSLSQPVAETTNWVLEISEPVLCLNNTNV